MQHKILIIDDSPIDLSTLKFLLERNGYQAKCFQDPEEGLAFVRQNRGIFSLAIVDYNIPGTTGAKVAESLKQIDPRLQIATYSGDSRPDVYESLAMGSDYFIQKGLDANKLLAIVKMFCNRFERAHKTLRVEAVSEGDLKSIQDAGFVGCSQHLADVVRLVQIYGPLDETVLITGENGTGKERVAQALHAASGRRGKFVAVNCGAIPHDLLESELFGHEKGAFSGAVRDKVGLVQAAMDGTLFLDEIGDLPLLLQVKLLRFLQEGEVRPVGSNSTVQVNARVVLATNADLEAAILAGRFRQDLFYRIKGFPIHLKALRERKEDIRPLVFHFAQTHAKERGLKREFLEDTVKYLMRFDWPGNVRELEHEVKRAMTLASGEKVTMSDIHEKIRQAIEEPADTGGVRFGVDYEDFKERQRRRDEEEERRFLAESSKRARSVRELARDVLKVSNSTLQGRLKALGVEFKPNKEQKGAI
jgi:DNA-binding NtrC family response regulator